MTRQILCHMTFVSNILFTMSVLKIIKFPDPLLKKTCEKVTKFDSSLELFINDMVDTLNTNKHCVGLAAPQVGSLKRIIVIDISKARKPHLNHKLQVLVNPEILESSDFKIVREGCLSIPDFTANVKRAMKIKVKYQNQTGEAKELETSNFEAHAIQHEMDHLDGILFLDKITNPASDLFRRKG